MQKEFCVASRSISRRSVLGAAAMGGASVGLPSERAFADACRLGPEPHEPGPLVFMDYDQIELDAAYSNSAYEPLMGQVGDRLRSASEIARARLGDPRRFAYGPTANERLDIYDARRKGAPIFVYIHGGTWRTGSARRSAYAAELFVDRGVHYIALDFVNVLEAGGDLRIMADQVRRGIAWVHRNAASFGGDRDRLFIGGHSSGGHLCGVALATDWEKDFGLPPNTIRGGLCMSGMYDLRPVRLSWRRSYIDFDDAMEHAISPIRHLDQIRAAISVSYGTFETPEFQRQGRTFAAALEAAGKQVKLIEAQNYAHLEIEKSLGNPYGANGRAAIEMIGLASN